MGDFDYYEESCPNCNAMWGGEEFELQRCFCCGWPNDGDYFDDDWDIGGNWCPECGQMRELCICHWYDNHETDDFPPEHEMEI